MNKKTRRHIIASIGTVVFMALVFLLLWLVYLSAVVPEEPEGIEIAFGTVEEAGGTASRLSESVPLPVTQPTPSAPTSSSENDLMTQEDEEALALQREREETERARKKAEEEAIARANALGALFGQDTGDTGTGDTQGNGQKGNPVGQGTQGGDSWSLAGRGIRGHLPKPANSFKQDGQVIVEIRVNAAGQVVSATLRGGNISDRKTIQLALDAARKAVFTEGDHDQIGTITYNFKFN